MPKGYRRCWHQWSKVGRAPNFAGLWCFLWRCDLCQEERDLFAQVNPNDHTK
jgi:hypothetical protein